MKLNKLLICLILIFCLTASSCSKKYDQKNYEKFYDHFYEQIITEGSKYVGVDLRTKVDYESSHVRQFQNYDLSKGSVSELVEWLNNNYKSKDYQIYLYGPTFDKDLYKSVKKSYKNVYYCYVEYESISDYLSNKFIIDTGEYDCGC